MKPCNCGHGKASASQTQQGRAMEFLQGLHHRYSMLRSQILLMDSFPNTIRIYALVRQEEKQQEIHFMSPPVNAPEAAALLVNSAPFNAGNSSSSRANGNNHSSNRSNNSQRNNGRDNCRNGKANLHCDYCGYNNHTKDVCYKLHGFPNDRSRNSSRNQNFSERALVAPPLIT